MKAAFKDLLRQSIIGVGRGLRISSKYFGAPGGWIDTREWVVNKADRPGVSYAEIFPARQHAHRLPATVDDTLHKVYSSNANWQQPAAFVASIPGGRVWGRNGAVVTPDDLLLDDVSREFGRREGVFNKEHSIFKQIKLAPIVKLDATVAVIAASGSSTYYHWLFDILPRIGLLKQAGLFEKIDLFVIDYTGLRFQKESLEALGIPESKVLRCNDHWKFHVEAKLLIVPSLTGRLSTISDWTIGFLRETFLNDAGMNGGESENLYISRKKAPTRKLVNESEIEDAVLKPNNFREFLAEDFSIRETASIFSKAKFIIGVHGSGFANIAFCKPGTLVIDIVAPRHVGPYFWFLTDYVKSDYGYLFGVGERASQDEDLISDKVDHDIQLNVDQLKLLMKQMDERRKAEKVAD